MTLLFITKYLQNDYNGIIKELHVVLLAFMAVFVAMLVDLLFGIKAAIKRGEARTSYGFRRSTLKFLEYYACMLIAFLIDVIASISNNVNMPYITFIMAMILIAIEAYSIYENFQNKKLKAIDKNDIKTIIKLIDSRDDILNAVIEAAKDKINQNNKE